MLVTTGKKKEKLPFWIKMSPGSLPKPNLFPKTIINPTITKNPPSPISVLPKKFKSGT